MIITPNMHLGFNCKDLEKSIQWYETFLNCKEKFTIYYGDMIPDSEERRANMDKDRIKYLESIRDVKWIVYMEFQDLILPAEGYCETEELNPPVEKQRKYRLIQCIVRSFRRICPRTPAVS